MRATRIAYYCSYAKNNDDLPSSSGPFTTEQLARAQGQKLARQGFWGAIEKHQEWKQDYENETAWLPDWDRAAEKAIQILDYF